MAKTRRSRKGSRLGRLNEPDDACKVQAGGMVEWDGSLTPTQCERFPSGKKIGQGSFATAYVFPDDEPKVVKFTGDPEDAKAARRLLGKRLKGAVQVYDVAQLKGQEGKAGRHKGPIFGIVTERVDPLPTKWYDAVGGVVGVIDDYAVDIEEDLKKTGKIGNRYRERMQKACSKWGNAPACETQIPVLVEAVEELYENGVFSQDLHPGNWGVRGERPVVLDFGVSATQGEPLPIDLAGRVRRRRKGGR
jgi:hypothetical protein